MKNLITAVIVCSSLLLSGCIYVEKDGSGPRRGPNQSQPTIGQELLDLDRARSAGAINEVEYEQAKGRILAR